MFGAMAGLLYVVLVIVWGQVMPGTLLKNLNYRIGAYGHMHSRIKEVKQSPPVDILFLGSSHAYRSFDPRIFSTHGFTSFNLGSSSQSPVQTELLVNKYLARLQPKLVVFEVYPGTFMSDGVESTLDLLSNGEIDPPMARMALSKPHARTFNTLIYGSWRQMLKLDAKYTEPVKKDKDIYISGGYVQSYQKYVPKGHFGKQTWSMIPEQTAAFERVLRLLKDKGIPFMLVQAPVAKERYASYTNNDRMDLFFAGHGAYYNFNKTLDLPDSLFSDSHHLNQYGTDVFDEKLIEQIAPMMTKP